MPTATDTKKLALEMHRDCVAMRVRLLNRRITRLYDAALRPYDVTTAQLNILVALALAGDARATDVAAALAIEKSTLSRNLARMVERGWLSATEDARGTGKTLRLLAAGRTLVERAMPAWKGAQRQARRELEPALVGALDACGPSLPSSGGS
jgi:DNA-binding MarR family transcriptional regulator